MRFESRENFSHLKTQHKWTSEDNIQLMNECPFCKVLYWRKSDLESHITNIHRKAFNCSFCGLTYKSKPRLKVHIEYNHNGKEKEQCQICKKEFQGKHILEGHIAKVHEEKKPHLCSICSFSTSEISNLKKHIKGDIVIKIWRSKVLRVRGDLQGLPQESESGGGE